MDESTVDLFVPTTENGLSHQSHINVDPISDWLREMFQLVNYVVIGTAGGLVGIVVNIINIIIFIRLGFTDSVNVSLLALSISDLGGLLTLEWFNVCVNPLLLSADINFVPPEFQYITAGWPHLCFTRMSLWITAFITIERCLCIAVPLKVKVLLTPRRTAIAVVSIVLTIVASVVPTYCTVHIDWKFYPAKNRSLLGLVVNANREVIEGITIATNVTLQFVSFLTIITSTAILVINLKQKSKWRQSAANSATRQSNALSKRDKNLGKMIILLSTILIVCFIPSTISLSITLFQPEFGVVGRYENSFFFAWSVVWVFHVVNATVNIFVYYRMSSKFRAEVNKIFRRGPPNEGN